ncbi:RNA polymerase sigma factor [Streptomyces sp. NPDC058457]|uniref:RNA polymerase sigma factor n=1 Tax=Streptomyces sp. NPDC058457 TaxID=3346507 RepID=UPI003662771E
MRRRIRAGDHDAFAALFDAYARSVYNHAFRLTGQWTTAEEVVSLTFLEAWRLRASLDEDGGSPRPWLLGIATNIALPHSRLRSSGGTPVQRRAARVPGGGSPPRPHRAGRRAREGAGRRPRRPVRVHQEPDRLHRLRERRTREAPARPRPGGLAVGGRHPGRLAGGEHAGQRARLAGQEKVQLIFDEKTYAFLGERVYDLHGTSMGGTSIVTRAVVDKAGERP